MPASNYSFLTKNQRLPEAGDYIFECEKCGCWRSNIDMVEQWDGLITCSRCYDGKHPLLDNPSPASEEPDDVIRKGPIS